ncbi:MAG: endonuclease MutS2 [Oscillospiraceae bacterium]|jgi:DNA mismatch repair protein MutS2|nr:endonuclease MutS2 [Oscillospiraceae bacterium]
MIKASTNRHYKALELDKILLRLSEQAGCADARELALELMPQTTLFEAQALLNQTEDAYIMLAKYGGPSFGGLKNINNALARAAAGSVLSMKELLDVAEVLRTIRAISEWRSNQQSAENRIDVFFGALVPNKYLEDIITSAILSEEEMADSASPELYDIRRKIRQQSANVRNQLDRLTHSAHYQKFLQDAIITQRNGRFVVPVKSEYRGEIPGLVHDTSSSGATVFIEPMAVVESNNEINVLKSKERAEIERILTNLSAETGIFQETIKAGYECAVELCLIFAKAQLAYKMKASLPILNDKGITDLKKARHPLLNQDTVVPTSITLGFDFDTLVITGPNTGGKTVSIKTIGLLTLMAMCGLMIPAGDNSRVCVFKKVFADIGDEQSIEQSLSTFSSHMVNIVGILKEAGDDSLVLIDELGAGTDPVEGAALAMAILERLKINGCKIAATTHYSELKAYALQTHRVENGSCEFDVQSLRPTYRLLVGVPGRSNAFAISERLGMEKLLVDRAREFISGESIRFEDVVDSLEQSRLDMEKQKAEAERLKAEAQSAKKEAEQLRETAEKQRQREFENAEGEAKRIVENARRQASALLEEIEVLRKAKNAANDPAELARRARVQLKQSLNALDDAASPVIRAAIDDANYTLPRPLVVGDAVLVADIAKEATVLSLPNKSNQVEVQAGILKLRTPLSNLRLLEKQKQKVTSGNVRRQTESLATKEVSTRCDLRGMTVEEGLMELDRFIDTTILSGMAEFTVIHGKGTGALRTAVHKHLRSHPQIKTFRLGVFGEGENGVTIAEIK